MLTALPGRGRITRLFLAGRDYAGDAVLVPHRNELFTGDELADTMIAPVSSVDLVVPHGHADTGATGAVITFRDAEAARAVARGAYRAAVLLEQAPVAFASLGSVEVPGVLALSELPGIAYAAPSGV